ncbi:PREDICTED: putative protein TPRXL [Priapulus caudatus]|uniref:Uncharacterized protein n=1 Tax=Priapulus caudatus TaxID=37621 RepID=A0ABM1DSN7_PRICU|nr:PREDICTED: putative protein TPRXL [Priapulus caudatus]
MARSDDRDYDSHSRDSEHPCRTHGGTSDPTRKKKKDDEEEGSKEEEEEALLIYGGESHERRPSIGGGRIRADSLSVLSELLRAAPGQRSTSLIRSPARLTSGRYLLNSPPPVSDSGGGGGGSPVQDSGYYSPALLSIARPQRRAAFTFPSPSSSSSSSSPSASDDLELFSFGGGDASPDFPSSGQPDFLRLPTLATSQRRASVPMAMPGAARRPLHPPVGGSAPTTPARSRCRPQRCSTPARVHAWSAADDSCFVGPTGNPCRSISTQTSVEGQQRIAARRGEYLLIYLLTQLHTSPL